MTAGRRRRSGPGSARSAALQSPLTSVDVAALDVDAGAGRAACAVDRDPARCSAALPRPAPRSAGRASRRLDQLSPSGDLAVAPDEKTRAAREPFRAAHIAAGYSSALQGDEALLGQLEHRVGRALAGVAGVLDAAVGLLVGAEGRDLVDQDAAELERPAGLQAAADVAGEDAGLEAELGVVGQLQRFAELREGVDRGDRAEDLLAPDLGVFGRRAEQGRGEAAALVDQLAAGQQLGPGGDRLVDPRLDPVAVVGGDQRADVGVRRRAGRRRSASRRSRRGAR